ncbi:MAG TPA: AMIN domain-containing protein [Gemmatimonadaceae bacterium]|nr:AMIN domain-containing protein [Gemmatimonadaceae bacterium]
MRRVWTLVAGSAVALSAAAANAAAAPAATRDSAATPRASGNAPAVGETPATPRGGAVTGLSVVPATGRAEVVIAVDSAVSVQDFTLSSPNRIVLDLSGATLAMPPRFYDKVSRGGVKNVRFAQYRAEVVRVVIELDAARKYQITRSANEMRVSLESSNAKFAAWHSGPAMATAAAAYAAGDRDNVVATPAAPAPRAGTPSTAAADEVPTTARVDASKSSRNQGAPLVQQQRQSTQPRITVTYQDADIRDVLAAFAAFSGRTIVVGRDVSGTVTAEIRDQPWDVALQALLQAQGLAASEDQYNIITVDSYGNILAKQSSEPLVTQLVAVNYANANSLIPTISSLLSRDCQAAAAAAPGAGASRSCAVRGSVSADTATNTLLITEVPSRINDVISYVRDLDIRTPQVAIKAKIIFVSRTNIEQLGVSYDLGSSRQFFNKLVQRTDPSTGEAYPTSDDIIDIGGNSLSAISNANQALRSTAALNLIYSTMIGKFSLTSFINALQEVRLADTQAEPNIVTLDNRRAEILVGEETPIRVVDVGQGGGTPAKATTQFKESGIILSVTPHITNNRQIQLQLHAEQSQLQAAASDLGFTFLKRRADSQLLVGDGETAAIGGLTITQVTTSKSGIPFLVDLPLIGRLFGETSTNESKQDLLILITPHIIDEGEAVRSR